jgi:hypothetical protein
MAAKMMTTLAFQSTGTAWRSVASTDLPAEKLQTTLSRRQRIFHFPFKIFHFVIAERHPSVNGKMENLLPSAVLLLPSAAAALQPSGTIRLTRWIGNAYLQLRRAGSIFGGFP